MTARKCACAVSLLIAGLYFHNFAYAEQPLIIRKTASEANPGLFLADFRGSEEIRSRLVRTLVQCDWFTVQNSAQGATYILRATYSASPTPALDMEITTGSSFVRFRQTGGARPNWLVYRTVDTLITKLFRNPGLCASAITFVNGGRGYKEIFVCNFDGTDARQVTFNRSISTEPSWGPGGTTLVYTLYQRNATDVVLADLVNRRHRPLSQFPGLNAGAELSPDGQWAALCLSRDRRVELYLLGVSDHALLRLTNDAAVEASPTWSPSGSQICFVSDRAGRPNLYLISARGGTAQRLVPSGAEAVSPSWSRVSNKICFATRAGGDYVLAVLDMTDPNRKVELLPTGGGKWMAPSWAPDGRHLVAAHQVGSSRELCMVDSWTGKVTRITTPGEFSLPSWSSPLN